MVLGLEVVVLKRVAEWAAAVVTGSESAGI